MRRAARFLRRTAPLNAPCRIVFRSPAELLKSHGIRRANRIILGDADFSRGQYLVRLSDAIGTAEACKTLAHEWAHCLTWRLPGEESDHGPLWRAANRRLWRELKKHLEHAA